VAASDAILRGRRKSYQDCMANASGGDWCVRIPSGIALMKHLIMWLPGVFELISD
jgi:hypothetical protein